MTRASSGIGQELAWQLGQCGAKLTVAARRQETLEREQIVTGHGKLLGARGAFRTADDSHGREKTASETEDLTAWRLPLAGETPTAAGLRLRVLQRSMTIERATTAKESAI